MPTRDMFEPSQSDHASSRSNLEDGFSSTPASKKSEHVSLYRKYRPQTFAPDELVGQEPIVQALRNAVRLDRVAHAYLFAGPRGTGKTTTARLLAKAVNCLDPDPEIRPCNQCPACVAISNGSAVDVVEIDAASNRGIDDIRDLRERVRFVPTSLKTKFYIIDEAHQITGAAANAFLKTLEEPPDHTRFVLATTDPEQILSTIVSRCQRFDFRRFSVSVTVELLQSVAVAEGIAVSSDALRLIAEQSTGSMRDALGLLDQLSVYGEKLDQQSQEITEDDVRALLGIARSDVVIQLIKAISEKNAGKALELLNEAIDRGEDARQINQQLVEMLRQLMLMKVAPATQSGSDLAELNALFEPRDLIRLARHFNNVDFRGRSLPVPHLPLEIALAQVCLEQEPSANSAAESVPSKRTPTGIGRPAPQPETTNPAPSLVERASARPTPSSSPEQAGPANTTMPPVSQTSAAVISVADLDSRWSEIRAEVKAKSRRIEALLTSVNPVEVNGSTIVLVSAYPFHRDKLNEPDVKRLVEDVISSSFGQRVSLSVQLHSEKNSAPANGSSGTNSAKNDSAAMPEQDKAILDMARRIYDADVIDP